MFKSSHRAWSLFAAVLSATIVLGAVSPVAVFAQGGPVAVGRMVPVESHEGRRRAATTPDGGSSIKEPASSSDLLGTIQQFDGASSATFAAETGTTLALRALSGDVSDAHYVQSANGLISIYDKAGALAAPPYTFASSYGPTSACATPDTASIVIRYDPVANVWVMVGVAAAPSGYSACIVKTATEDAYGAFSTTEVPLDSATPSNLRLAVWTDGYYLTWERYIGGTVFDGSGVLAVSRALTMSFRIDLPVADAPPGLRMVPADLDGVRLPPAERPLTLAALSSVATGGPVNGVRLFEVRADWVGGTATMPEVSSVAFAIADTTSPAGAHDIRQPSPATDASALDSGAEHELLQLQYRHDGAGTESLVMAHSIGAPASTVLGTYKATSHFYHLRRTSLDAGYALYDQGSAPLIDTASRWAPGAALDGNGTLLMGFSGASDSVPPSLALATRSAQATPGGAIDQALLVLGSGVQLSATGAWPASTPMSVDPSDDCRFWYTGPYYTAASQASSSVGWLTRIASVIDSGCQAPAMGTVAGTVKNLANNAALEGVTVLFSNGWTTTTAADGTYSRRLPVGQHAVTFSRSGFQVLQYLTTVNTGATSVLSPLLLPDAGPVLLAAGVRLLTESRAPANGAVDPGETVTVEFGLTNIGSPTSNLTATLMAQSNILNPSAAQVYGALATGASAQRSFTFRLSPTISCGLPVYATLQLADGTGLSSAPSFVLPTSVERGSAFSQRFDGVTPPALPAGWAASNTPGAAPLWATSAATPYDGTASVIVDAPGAVSDKRLGTPSFPVGTAGSRVTFRHSFSYESGYDGGVLELFHDGVWEDILAAGGTFLEGGYTGGLSPNYSNPLGGRQAWTGSSGGYKRVIVALPDSLVGHHIQLRWRSGTDTSNADSGWSVDAFSVTDSNCGFASGEFMTNGDFSQGVDGFTGWSKFSLPDISYMPWGVNNGVLEYSRSTGSTQGVMFQQTGVPVAARQPLEATFQMRNTTNTRKRFSVLMHDGDFSDLSVCTFWMEANVPLANYTMRMAPTKAWTNATISFYAATVGNTGGGSYGLANVSLKPMPTGTPTVTDCRDPRAPQTTGTAGGELLVNGGFDTGQLTPWSTFGNINWTIAGNVFVFHKLAGTPAGVVLQNTNAPLATDDRFTVSMSLGNASAVRQRVTVLVHARDFSDLTACTFWLPPATPPATYSITGFATKAWPFASVSVYPATTATTPSTLQWLLLDNVSLTKTTTATGTTCQEPQ